VVSSVSRSLVSFSKYASTPSPFAFSCRLFARPFLPPTSSSTSFTTRPGCYIGSFGLPPDNANWCQTCAPRPSCLTSTFPLVISLIVHLSSSPRFPFRLPLFQSTTPLLFPPTFRGLNVLPISLGQLSMALANPTSFSISQTQGPFPTRASLSPYKTADLQ
jgi:hypothetical protein